MLRPSPTPPQTTPRVPLHPDLPGLWRVSSGLQESPTAPPSSQAKFLGCFPRESMAFCLGVPCVRGRGSWWLSEGCRADPSRPGRLEVPFPSPPRPL